MTSFDQKNQKVNTSYNAEYMHINMQSGDNPRSSSTHSVPTNIDSKRNWSASGTTITSTFKLSSNHTITYRRDDNITNWVIHLYVDGEEVYSEKVNPILANITKRFKLEGVDCHLSGKLAAGWLWVNVKVGGIQVLST